MDFACARLARLGGGNTSEVLSQMGGYHELQLNDVTFCARRRTTYRLENTVRDSTELNLDDILFVCVVFNFLEDTGRETNSLK